MKLENILAPWEYDSASPPKICEIHCLSLMWKGEKRPLVAALLTTDSKENSRYLAFRLENDDAGWTFSHKLSGREETFFSRFAPSASIVEKRIEVAIRDNHLIRQFVFKWDGTPKPECLVTLSASGYGFWDDTRFYFPVDNFLDVEAQTIHDNLSAELENPDSDLAFARQFSLLGPSSRRARLLGLKAESQLEEHLVPLRTLWQWVLASYDEDVNMFRRQSNFANRIADIEVRGQKECETPRELKIWVQPKDERLQFWAELLIQYGPVQLDFNALEKYTALHDFHLSHGYTVRESCESPTFHERVEAKIKLLEWAKNHLPPEKYAEIKALES